MVTSCRSDAYHDQRVPVATSKFPRRAPSALDKNHELAVGINDAYEAGGGDDASSAVHRRVVPAGIMLRQ